MRASMARTNPKVGGEHSEPQQAAVMHETAVCWGSLHSPQPTGFAQPLKLPFQLLNLLAQLRVLARAGLDGAH